MSVRYTGSVKQIRNESFHRAIVASTSLIALSAAMGWSNPALATGTCGAPNGSGVVNCSNTNYPGGIEYTGGNAVDDLTVNLGSFAGQSGHVEVGDDGIAIGGDFSGDVSESIYIGKNVTVSATGVGQQALNIYAFTAGKIASVSVTNEGVLKSADSNAIHAYTDAVHTTGNAFSYSSVANTGHIVAYDHAIGAYAIGSARSTKSVTATATGQGSNNARIVQTGEGGGSTFFVGALSQAYSETGNATSIATVTLINTGNAVGGTDHGASIYGRAKALGTVGGHYTGVMTSGAYSTLKNSGKVKTGEDTGAIFNEAVAVAAAYAGPTGAAAAYATAIASTSNSGDLTTGLHGKGIDATGGAYAIGYYDSGATAASAVKNSGTIATTGDNTFAIGNYVKSVDNSFENASATAVSKTSNKAAISTSGSGSNAIATAAYSYAGVVYGVANALSVAKTVNSGALTTNGDGSVGISNHAVAIAYGFPDGPNNSYASAYAIVKNTGAITAHGEDADGIRDFASVGSEKYTNFTAGSLYGTGKVVATVVNSGEIKTHGLDASGIILYGYSKVESIDGARGVGVSTVTNSGIIRTHGAESFGLGVLGGGDAEAEGIATGAGYATANNSASITTHGKYAAGILAEGEGVAESFDYHAYSYGVATVNNSGAIKTRGASKPAKEDPKYASSAGIEAVSFSIAEGEFASSYAATNVNNSGAITTKGTYSAGIVAISEAVSEDAELAQPYANITVVNSGTITTKGDGAQGIFALSETATNGEFVYSASRSSVTNTGAVTTEGFSATGIANYAYFKPNESLASHGYASASVTNGGSVTTSGDNAVGIVVKSFAEFESVYESNLIVKSSVTNTGSVTTSGIEAMGIVAQTTSEAIAIDSGYYARANGTASVTNGGSVTVTGLAADGVRATTESIAAGEGGGRAVAKSKSLVTNTGSVTAAHGYGIQAYSLAATEGAGTSVVSAITTVNNSGNVLATGHAEVGVFAAAAGAVNGVVGAGVATVYNSGDIMATGKAGIGVKVEAAQAYVTTTGGLIEGGKGPKGVGVYASGGAAIVTNGGAIGSLNNHAVDLHGLYYAVLTNTGTVTGFATIATSGPTSVALPGATAFLNYGTWIAKGGNTVLSHAADGPASNLVNEVPGEIEVVGNQSFTADTFTNLGVITMQQAATGSAGRPAFETLTVSGDYTGVGGKLAVDANTGLNKADVLSIKGTASGQTGVDVDIVGTPTAISGTSLIVAKTTHGAAPGEFTLIGNTSAHTEVAGAFEYNLAFKAGPGTSGDWYLTSQIWPGIGQFGQIGSSAALVADQVNIDLRDILVQTGNAVQTASLDSPVQVAAADNSFVPQPNGSGLSGWGRYNEARFNVDPSGSAFSDYKLRVDTAQFGIDEGWHDAGNTVVVGALVAPFRSWSDFADFGTHISSQGTAYSLYGLWFSGAWQAGLKFDYDDISSHYTDTFIGTNATVKPNEKSVQAAASYLMPMDDWTFEPSAELNYGTSKSVQLTDGVGDLVRVGSTNDFWGKLNARIFTDVETAHSLLVQPYANIGLVYRGDSATSVNIGTISTSTNVNGWDGEFGIGVNTNLATGLSLSAEADYLAGNRVNGWTGFLSLRYTP